MKFLNILVISCVLLLPNLASATIIIDNGTYTTIDGIDWLDLTMTEELKISVALANNPGWEIATKSQFQNMFSNFEIFGDGLFDGETSIEDRQINGITKHTVTSTDYISNSFTDLFGDTSANTGIISLGWYTDGDIIRGGGSIVRDISNQPFSADTWDAYDRDYTELSKNVGARSFGTFLVRGVPQVPEPSTIILICLGLIGLVATRRKEINSKT
jgi:hypothetical protein